VIHHSHLPLYCQVHGLHRLFAASLPDPAPIAFSTLAAKHAEWLPLLLTLVRPATQADKSRILTFAYSSVQCSVQRFSCTNHISIQDCMHPGHDNLRCHACIHCLHSACSAQVRRTEVLYLTPYRLCLYCTSAVLHTTCQLQRTL